jgi:hypothetical protein
LREIAAASDYDFVAVEPRRTARTSSQHGKSGKKAARSAPPWLAAAWRFRTPAIGVTALFLMLGAIVVNAMFLQKQKHPAPLFGATFQIEQPKVEKPKAAAAQFAPRPGTIEALLSEKMSPAPLAPVGPAPASALAPPPVAAPAPIAAPASAAPAPIVRAEAPVKKNHDAIGALIGVGPAAAPPAPSRVVAAAQRALQKLGMVVNPDGRLDATTRRALEIFQHDNRLPASGELTPKTRMLLSGLSGVAVE